MAEQQQTATAPDTVATAASPNGNSSKSSLVMTARIDLDGQTQDFVVRWVVVSAFFELLKAVLLS